ncbi:MAG: ABC transporter substrate-binding protein [Desulfomonilaceae bacterium]
MKLHFRSIVFLAISLIWVAFPLLDLVFADPVKIKFGSIPALQSLPIYVADDRGLFSKEGLEVEVIQFNTAAEKDIALAAGSLDGCFADLVTPLAMKGNGQEIVMVAKNYDTRSDRRMFAIMAKPGSNYKNAKELGDTPVAISSNSVVDYATERLLTDSGLPVNKIVYIESKNIGLRFQMLVSGSVEVAALPEPLVSAAVDKGAKILADDSGLGETQTVIVFSQKFADLQPDAITRFLTAVNKANEVIALDPNSVRSVMVEKNRLPPNLKDTYPPPKFGVLEAPDRDCLQNISKWLHRRGIIKSEILYENIVNTKFIP